MTLLEVSYLLEQSSVVLVNSLAKPLHGPVDHLFQLSQSGRCLLLSTVEWFQALGL